jgi:protein-tyrosine phosphatase
MHTAPWWLAIVPLLVPLAVAMAQSPQISGALNFRDLGGLQTADGRVVRSGLIYRSGELNSLTDADLKVLASLKIGYIFDLRTDAERAAAPTNWIVDKPAIVNISVGFDAKEDPGASMKLLFSEGFGAAQATAAMQSATAKIAVDGAPEIGRILRSLGRGEEPAIIHCTAGKDRTGVVSAILLKLLGVPMDAVYSDYLRSNLAAPAQLMRLRDARGKSGMPSGLAAMPMESVKILMGVDSTFLDAAFHAIDAKYGSFQNYVQEGLKLTPADVEALRAHLL